MLLILFTISIFDKVIFSLYYHASMGNIIVLQSTTNGIQRVKDALKKGDMPLDHFMFFTDLSQCEEQIEEEKHQILILGSVGGSVPDAAGFVANMKRKNPRLVAIGFSGTGHIPGCDFNIDRNLDSAADKLSQLVSTYELAA